MEGSSRDKILYGKVSWCDYSVFVSKAFGLSFPTSCLLTYFSDFFISQLHFWSSRGQVLVLGYHISCPLYLLVWTMFCVLSTHVDLFGHLPQSTYTNWPNHHSTLLWWSCHYIKSWVRYDMIWCIRPEPTRSHVPTIYCSVFKYYVNIYIYIYTHTHNKTIKIYVGTGDIGQTSLPQTALQDCMALTFKTLKVLPDYEAEEGPTTCWTNMTFVIMLLCWRWGQNVCPEYWYPSTKSHAILIRRSIWH